ncbi:hypothetical protein PTTG_25971 [Puccinia triticina 1-1 BBBD Race 1]|uniref:Uncharacterized protein n=1 Tax=Puccinia triticina (isolate 1-1 / race 1 (BBBD)) TaxID=630390 RepID=A0A180GYC8_PUCT1|nr:hypothetical protein PTTG_25971 [Puccinia triticina 1-1 BBBD Race 1]
MKRAWGRKEEEPGRRKPGPPTRRLTPAIDGLILTPLSQPSTSPTPIPAPRFPSPILQRTRGWMTGQICRRWPSAGPSAQAALPPSFGRPGGKESSGLYIHPVRLFPSHVRSAVEGGVL